MIGSMGVRYVGALGGYSVARRLTRRDPKILMYHRFSRRPVDGAVSIDTFKRQVKTIKRKYRPVTVVDLARYLYEERRDPPENTVAITVDDGYQDFYDVAWPVLKHYSVPATFYVTTGFVNGDLWLWPDRLKWMIERVPSRSRTNEILGFTFPAPGYGADKKVLFDSLVSHLLGLPEYEKLRFLDELALVLGVRIPDDPPEDCRPATWEQLKDLQDGGIEIGGHTVNHPSLGRISLEDAKEEIVGCRETLDRNLGECARSFCYPNGTPSDFVPEQIGLVREAGFKCAVVAFADSVGHRQQFAMRRHASSGNMFQFHKAVSGLELLGSRVRGERWL